MSRRANPGPFRFTAIPVFGVVSRDGFPSLRERDDPPLGVFGSDQGFSFFWRQGGFVFSWWWGGIGSRSADKRAKVSGGLVCDWLGQPFLEGWACTGL